MLLANVLLELREVDGHLGVIGFLEGGHHLCMCVCVSCMDCTLYRDYVMYGVYVMCVMMQCMECMHRNRKLVSMMVMAREPGLCNEALSVQLAPL